MARKVGLSAVRAKQRAFVRAKREGRATQGRVFRSRAAKEAFVAKQKAKVEAKREVSKIKRTGKLVVKTRAPPSKIGTKAQISKLKIKGFKPVKTPAIRTTKVPELKVSQTDFRRQFTPETRGMVMGIKAPTTRLGKFEETLKTQVEAESRLRREQPQIKTKVRAFGAGLAQSAIGTGRFYKQLTTEPKATVKGIAALPKKVKEEAPIIKKQIRTAIVSRPAATAGFVTGEVGIGYATGKVGKGAVKRVPIKPQLAKLKIGERTLYRGVGVRYKGRGRALLGFTDEVRVGTPEVSLKGVKFDEFVPTKAVETEIYRRGLRTAFPEEEVLKFEKGVGLLRRTEKVPSKFIRKRFIQETKTLSPKAITEVLSATKKQKGTAYGSFAARQQLPEDLAALRTPADIDIQLRVGEAQSAKFTQNLVKKLKARGEKVRISKQSKTLIEAQDPTGRWHHAVDIHSSDIPLTETSPAATGTEVFGLRLAQKPLKIEGIRVMPLSEQSIRKGASIFAARDKKFAPRPHRLKDIPDFFTTQEALLRSKKVGRAKGLAQLEELKGLFPEELVSPKTRARVTLEAPKPPKKPSRAVSPPISPRVVSPSVGLPSPSLPSISLPSPSLPSPSRPSPSIVSPSFPAVSISVPSPSLPSPSIPSPSIPSPSAPSPYLYSPAISRRVPSPKSKPLFDFDIPLIKLFPERRKPSKKIKQPKKYQPSLRAILFDIRAPVAPRGTTGLGLRPIVTKKKKKKRWWETL